MQMNSDIFNSMWVKTYLCVHNGFLKLTYTKGTISVSLILQ